MSVSGIFGTVLDLGLVILGFSLIIVLHELGHFLAARWAGIRVLAFAVGFGPALFSFRKGLGWRRGSSEREYQQAIDRDASGSPGGLAAAASLAMSSTEYRLNALPLGGYVKMLGQDDANPAARSTEKDSFQCAPVWKRMIVISAGVVMNLITAVVLFVIVFHVGLKTEAPLIGSVDPKGPAASAVAINARELGVTKPGLHPGDRVISANASPVDSFNDFAMAAAMAGQHRSVLLEVQREGLAAPLKFDIKPVRSEATKFMSLGVGAMPSLTIGEGSPARAAKAINEGLAKIGYPGLEMGMRLERINSTPARSYADLLTALDASRGNPILLEFAAKDGSTHKLPLKPVAELIHNPVEAAPGKPWDLQHLLGMTTLIGVASVMEGSTAEQCGLKKDDVFVQIGSVEWPSVPAAIAELQSHAGKSVRVVVARAGADGAYKEVDLGQAQVSSGGTLGFGIADTARQPPIIARWPSSLVEAGTTPSGAALGSLPGTQVVSINDQPVASLGEARDRLRAQAATAPRGEPLSVSIISKGLLGERSGTLIRTQWLIPASELAAIHELGYTSPLPSEIFGIESTLLKAPGVIPTIKRGVRETHRVMIQTYLTIAGLFDGSVRVEHLKGPVGIAHVGVLIADRGFVWLMFFMALISVNLAVINFLPLPIVDGGHMIFLTYEQITGRPPPVSVQNGAALAGLVLIGSIFLVVTAYNIRDVFIDIFR